MLTLFDNAFSPFARKVRMVLEFKQLPFTAIDGLDRANHAALAAVNPRAEVPVLVDGDAVIVNSAHIVAYLDEAYPQVPVLPASPAERARCRNWERISDTLVDAIVVDAALWTWAERGDSPPAGMFDKARRDLDGIYAALERGFRPHGDYLCGDALTIADLALFPHLHGARALDLGVDPARFPRLAAWLRGMRSVPVVRADLDRLKAWLSTAKDSGIERRRIFWRGDRIEWLLASGFHDWFINEIRQERVLWPSTTLS